MTRNHIYLPNWSSGTSSPKNIWNLFFNNLYLFDSVSISFVTLNCLRGQQLSSNPSKDAIFTESSCLTSEGHALVKNDCINNKKDNDICKYTITVLLPILLSRAASKTTKVYVAIGGWSDINNTPLLGEDDVFKNLYNQIYQMSQDLNVGIEFDWEHLGQGYWCTGDTGGKEMACSFTDDITVKKCMFLGKLIRKLLDNNVSVIYTTRSNWLLPFLKGTASDCEGIAVLGGLCNKTFEDVKKLFQLFRQSFKTYNNLPSTSSLQSLQKAFNNVFQTKDDIQTLTNENISYNIMTYDGAVGLIAPSGQYCFNDLTYVLESSNYIVNNNLFKSRLNIGFEQVKQANYNSCPTTKEDVNSIVTYVNNNNYMGFIYWWSSDINNSSAPVCRQLFETLSIASKVKNTGITNKTDVIKVYSSAKKDGLDISNLWWPAYFASCSLGDTSTPTCLNDNNVFYRDQKLTDPILMDNNTKEITLSNIPYKYTTNTSSFSCKDICGENGYCDTKFSMLPRSNPDCGQKPTDNKILEKCDTNHCTNPSDPTNTDPTNTDPTNTDPTNTNQPVNTNKKSSNWWWWWILIIIIILLIIVFIIIIYPGKGDRTSSLKHIRHSLKRSVTHRRH